METRARWQNKVATALVVVSLLATSCGGSDPVADQNLSDRQPIEEAADQPVGDANEPAATAVPTAAPTATPEPTSTPEPTATPQPDLDGDGEPDATDADDDGDGADDDVDDFPTDETRSRLLTTYFASGEDGLALPDMTSTRALQALRDELATESTAVEDVEALFTETAIAQLGGPTIAAFLNDRRDEGIASFIVRDVRWVSEYDLRILLGPADDLTGQDVRLAIDPENGLIGFLSMRPGSIELASLIQPEQSELGLEEAVAGYAALVPTASVLVAEVVGGECSVLAAHEAATPVGVATVATGWLLGAAAQAIHEGVLDPGDSASVPPSTFGGVGSGSTASFAEPTELTVQQLASMMVQRGDAGAADALHDVVGSAVVDSFIESRAANPSVVIPLLSASNVSHVHASLDDATVAELLDGSDDAQRALIEEALEPLGPYMAPATASAAVAPQQTWQSSANDVCANLAALRSYPDHSASADFVNQAMSGNTGLPGLAASWDRVWHIAGGHPNPAFGQVSALTVHSLAWLVENEGGPAYAIVATMNADAGVPVTPWILDAFSHVTRIHQLLIP